MRQVDLTGKRFGRLQVLWPAGYQGEARRIMWATQCDDGNICIVSRANLCSGHTTSCGCFNRERTHEASFKHGMTRSPEWKSFIKARERCRDKSNKHYGGRGIEFRFESFKQFFAEIGVKPTPKHSIDRIRNEGHYESGNVNVKWSTHSEQMKNRRPFERKPRGKA